MYGRSSTALRVAVLLTLSVAACNDAPLAPRRKPPQGVPRAANRAGVQVFSGPSADSVVRAFDAVWARNSHPNYQQLRHAWRKANGIPDNIGDPGVFPFPWIRPNAAVTEGDGSVKPPPKILSHFEALHFGHVDQSMNVPDGIEAEVTFIGDQAEIEAGSVTITGNDGSTYQGNGKIAQGPGQLINCTDALSGTCDNRRRLSGVMVVPSAPTCDASGFGTVNYFAMNVSTPLGVNLGSVSSGTDGTQSTTSASGLVSSSASPCSSGVDGGQQSADSTQTAPTGPIGAPSGPAPPPTGPNVPYAPPPPTSGGTTTTFHCEQVKVYYFGMLFETTIVCYPN